MRFVRCKGKQYCVEDEQGCRTCGRSPTEMAATRDIIGAIADLTIEQGYENDEEFVTYLAEKALKAIRHRTNTDTPEGQRP